MELLKKIAMTQNEMLNFMEEKQQDALSSERQQFNRARKDMNQWLERKDIPEDKKAIMYGQELQKVNRLKKHVFQPHPLQVQMIDQVNNHLEQVQSESSDQETLSLLDKQIVDSVPKTMQNRAKLLIRSIKQHPDVISWNDKGQMIYEGSAYPNSNIIDLVNDVLRKRKGFDPDHSKTFLKGLAKINVPEDYVRHTDRLETMRTFRRIQDYLPSTPTSTSSSRSQKTPTTSPFVSGNWLKAPR